MKKKRMVSLLLALTLVLGFLPAGVAAAGEATIRVENVVAAPGEQIDVDIILEQNPGILGATLTFRFDEGLTLVNARAGEAFECLTMTKPGKFVSPCNFVWDGQDLAPEDIKDGVILTLTFLVSKDAPVGEPLTISVSYPPKGVVDRELQPLDLSLQDGAVTALDYWPGDLDGDQVVTTSDVIILRRYLAGGYEISIDNRAADVNGDGIINTADVITIRRYLAGGYGIELMPSKPQCNHSMEKTDYLAPTCTEEGHTAYWYCTSCEKYFKEEQGLTELDPADAILPALGHDPVVIPAVPATTTSIGYSEGSKCNRCGEILVKPEEIPMIVENTRNIIYNIANGDSYIASQEVENANPSSISTTDSMTLKHLSLPGYRFLGWFDLASGNDAKIVRTIAPGNDDVELYAHWEKIHYTIQFRSSLYPIDSLSYTVDTGAILPTPQLSNYIFAGWSDEDGNMYENTVIPIGSTENITLTANWTSERNKAVTKTELDAPVIYEDSENNMIYFAYEIGKIENVPLKEIKNFGYISGDGITKSETMTYTVSTVESVVTSVAETVSEATTKSSDWTLSNGWSQGTTVDEEWRQENGYTKEEAQSRGQDETSNWNISSSSGGSTDTTHLNTTEDNWQNEIRIENSRQSTGSGKIAAGLESSLGVDSFGVKAEVSASLNVEESYSQTQSSGMAIGGTDGKTAITTDSTVTNSNWNTASSYGGSKTSSMSQTTSRAITEMISQKTGYGQSYIQNEDWSNSQGFTSSSSSSNEYSTTVTFSKQTGEERTNTWTTQATKPGYHRWIIVGDAHVFAIVGYDIAQKSYFVSTMSIIGDETREFEDYSYTSATFSDNENGVISFEIPYEVAEYVADRTAASAGLRVDQQTGIITEYSGSDNCVVIPEYLNVGNGDVVKVTGISNTAFAGNTNIAVVVLSDYITSIPDNAFAGCTSLEGLTGGSITSIGSGAFAGCTSIVDCGITSKVTYLGNRAFEGVGRLQVNPATASVLDAAVSSGANQIVVYLEALNGGAATLQDKTLNVPAETAYFELNGYGQTFEDTALISDAGKTVINKANFVSHGAVPLTFSSPEVVLNQTSLVSPGISLILSAEETNLGLQGTISAETLLNRSLNLYEANASVVGKLSVQGTMFLCGALSGSDHLICNDIRLIDAQTFEGMMHSYKLFFDANGGSCDEVSRDVPNGTPIGNLPVAERENFHFIGWYTAPEGGTLVTEETIFSSATNQTIYAHWSPESYTVSWDTPLGYTVHVKRTQSLHESAAIGALHSGDAVFYGDTLEIEYQANPGYTLLATGEPSITVRGNVTSNEIFATASVNEYTVSWANGTGYTISVTRTASPYQGAATGALNSGATVYYGDKLEIHYAAATGYSLTGQGITSITVDRDITASDIFASASPNSYSYPIQYISSNGTMLGSSSATYVFGTSHTITPPSFSGYNTPAAQNVTWNATSKTITFTYTPTSVSNTIFSKTVDTSPRISYSGTVEYRNRTANSVQLRVSVTSTIAAGGWTVYGQRFEATCGSASTGAVQIAAFNSWQNASSSNRSSTGTSGWITVSLGTTKTTSVSMNLYYYQVNSNGTDMTKYYGVEGGNQSISVALPAY